MLPNRPPQVTFTCNMAEQSCGFQFWIGKVESFYCGLSNCTATFEAGYDTNSTLYTCEQVECACIPGRMLCGEDGSVGTSPPFFPFPPLFPLHPPSHLFFPPDISDFLTEEIKGPGKFSSRTGEQSIFEEPAMNQLINDIFGDTHITLKCHSGECLRSSDVPGFVVSFLYAPFFSFLLTLLSLTQRPPKPNSRLWVIASIVAVILVLLLGLFRAYSPCAPFPLPADPPSLSVFWYLGRGSTDVEYSFLGGRIRLPVSGSSNGDAGKSLLEDHIPAALQFSNLSYTLPNGKRVLDSISGAVQPGEIMAVLGASGAGKSTFLDLLARKAKRGTVHGEILVNGRSVPSAEYRRVVGFVDQEDTLMGTLTVYETVLYSALLRLPKDMSFEDKRLRTLETMHELGILGIRDSRIGESGQRSISGGEKRRVSIACELVTSPSILFLDEPTS
jgi:ABC-type lipoprotein export system ATPase subunit